MRVRALGNEARQTDQSVPNVGTVLPDHGDLTIYDVARAAGVAPSTVSRALSKPGRVSFKTAEHVRQVAEELGYRSGPDGAHGVRTGHRNAGRRGGRHRQPRLLRDDPRGGARQRGSAASRCSSGDAGIRADGASGVGPAGPEVDGAILASSRMSDAAIRSLAKRKPIVLLNRTSARSPRSSSTT